MNSQKKQSPTERLSEVWVLALFKKLQALYLHKWTSALEGIEKTAMTEWAQALGGLSGEQIKTGLANLNSEWPPSAIDFRKLCENKQTNGLGLDYAPPYHSQVKRDRTLDSDENKERRRKAYSIGMGGIKDILKE
jgi:hypothetical protein